MGVIKMPLFIGDYNFIGFEDAADGTMHNTSLSDVKSITLEFQGIEASSGDSYAHHKIFEFVKGAMKIATTLDSDTLAGLSAMEARNRSEDGLLKIVSKLNALVTIFGDPVRELRSETLKPIISYPVIAAENAASLSKSSIPPLIEIINRELLDPYKYTEFGGNMTIKLFDAIVSNVRLTGSDHTSAEANPVEFDILFQNMKVEQPTSHYWWWEKPEPQE